MRIEKCFIDNLDSADKSHIGSYGTKFKKSFILKVIDEKENLTTIAICSVLNNEELNNELDILAENFKLYSEENNNNEYDEWKNTFLEKLKDCVYLEYIESIKKGVGGAKFLIEYIKNNYNKFWLYSAFEAEEYWSEKIKLRGSEEYFYSTETIYIN
ncbi:hypothetical protein UT300003_32220 [Clostridium sardiniense]